MSSRSKLLALGLLATVVLGACGSSSKSSSGASGSGSVALVAYSTPKPAYDQLIKAFNDTPSGKGVSFSESYGASGDQARAVLSGLDASYVAFSIQTDMDKLVKAGKVATSWNTGPTKGFVTDSVVVFVVRKGNPKHITSWADLVKPGVKVVTPNPFSSGSRTRTRRSSPARRASRSTTSSPTPPCSSRTPPPSPSARRPRPSRSSTTC